MKIRSGSKLVMIGDSVTDMERARPLGEGLFNAWGKGYVANVEALLSSCCPEQRIRVINVGVSGNTVRDLKARWQTDVMDLKPDWVSIMIGINDVWRQFDTPMIVEGQVHLEEYEKTLVELVEKTLPVTKGMVLMTPYLIESNRKDAMRARMEQYGKIVRKTATKYKTLFVDTQAAFDEVLQHVHAMSIAWDRVHPNAAGHMLLARAFLKGIGFNRF